MDALQITLFGQVTVVHPQRSAPLKLSHSSQAILAFLLLRPHFVQREILLDVFWMNIPPDRARSSLATALWRLRQLLEPDDVRPGTYLIASNTGEVGFNWESRHWLDAEEFEQPIHLLLRKPTSELDEDDIARIEALLTLYRGEFLEGIYEDWALRERERFRMLHLNCLTRLMEFHASRGNFAQSIGYGHEILRRDPLREEIQRSLMRLYLESGQRSLAIRQYARCCELLNQELGVPPLEETQALYRQIMTVARVGTPTAPIQPTSADLTQLLRELQTVKQNIDEAARTLARVQAAVSQFANIPLNGPSGDGAVMQK